MADVPSVLTQVPVEQKLRYENIKKTFEAKYGRVPTFFARAPGRVNLIGEHIDYCGYAVLPMAIEQDNIIAASPNEDSIIRLANINPEYEPFSCKTTEVVINKEEPRWQHYFFCGYRGVQEHFKMTGPVGMDILMDGSVPRSAGLSSSSALVCCAALTTMRANGKSLTKLELSEICQRCEHYIGTEGGGMDQAICFLAQPGTAKLIEFDPVRPTDVKLPDGATFVISNCCVELNKAATGHFNTRVAECRLATQVLAKAKGFDWRKIRRLGNLHAQMGVTLDAMVKLVEDTLHPAPYSKQEVCDILQVTPDELNDISLSEKTVDVEEFKLRDRALHVFSEAQRVWQFKKTCDDQPAGALETLGQLMSASHSSCSQLYQCSCSDLDDLVKVALSAGALGSRLTGAGWGGCAVSLVPGDKLASFLLTLKEEYYAKDKRREEKVSEHLFATQPGSGALFVEL